MEKVVQFVNLMNEYIIFPDNYPNAKPEMIFLTPIYHLNVKYFASENHLVEKHEKQKELYGFGPGFVGENYNFINDQGEIILYSITGNLDD